jgi:hypothetical protein
VSSFNFCRGEGGRGGERRGQQPNGLRDANEILLAHICKCIVGPGHVALLGWDDHGEKEGYVLQQPIGAGAELGFVWSGGHDAPQKSLPQVRRNEMNRRPVLVGAPAALFRRWGVRGPPAHVLGESEPWQLAATSPGPVLFRDYLVVTFLGGQYGGNVCALLFLLPEFPTQPNHP